MRRRCAVAALLLSLWGAAWGQCPDSGAASAAAPFGAPVDDERIFTHLLLDQFEALLGSSDALRWDAQGWAGTDENRLYLLTEGETRKGSVTDGLDELLYDRPITPFFDLQAGVRSDLDSDANRTWAALGVAGLAPYFLELSTTVYASDTGHYAARAMASYDLLLTQRLILSPMLELNAYSKADPARQTASGLSGIEAELRVRYEITRSFAPYLGVSFERRVAPGVTGGEDQAVNNTRVALGVRAWL